MSRPQIIDTRLDLSALFKKQVKETPDLVALEDENHTYTYTQLDDKVESLTRNIGRYGVERDSLVGVLLGRSADYVIACLAALRAGGAFLVLENAYPTELLNEVIEDANPAVILTTRSEVGRIRGNSPLIILDEEQSGSNGHANGHSNGDSNGHANVASDETDPHDLDKLAFVCYSSGTTGRPKGIACVHKAAVYSYNARFGLSDLKPGDRVACNVFFIWEILRPLLRGATVVAIPDETSYDPGILVNTLQSKKITETLMTPTLLAAVLSRHQALATRLPDLRTLWLNGEVVTTDLAQKTLKALPKCRLLNVYSACETHEVAAGVVSEMISDDAQVCPVGPLLDPKRTYILDDSGQRVENGNAGELFVGGHQLARGYLNLPETTAKAFIPDPFDPAHGAYMYRTGDLARITSKGLLEITGRVGAMIKLRGYSIVPAKVQKAIVQNLAVRDCVVTSHGEGLNRQLVAYIADEKDSSEERPSVKIDDGARSPAARRVLSQALAQYMIPTLWVRLDKIPTHAVSGKIDMKALPEPGSTDSKPVSPVRATAKKDENDPISLDAVAEIWAATLSTPRSAITPEHNFFDLGGHSLLLSDLASRFSKNFGFRVPVARLADPPTLNGHLHTVRAVRDGHTAAVQADLPNIMRADSVLDKDIVPAPGTKLIPANKADTILLTGATGFLGPFILNDLLESTSAKIICLVRFSDPTQADIPAGIARLRRNLLDFGLWSDSIMERIEILPGNLSRKRFGIPPEPFEQLAKRVQVIVHAAATVNLVYPYAALRNANVGGTREILRLAAIGGATVQYVSTNGVLPPSQEGWPETKILEVDEVASAIPDGYGQTKCVAEYLAREAVQRGLPVRILRAGTISGHSASGASNAYDLLTSLIVESTQLGHYPDVPNWRTEMTPVDFVSKSIVHLANITEDKSSPKDQLIFHLGDPQPVTAVSVFEHLNELGFPTTPLPFEEWVSLWTSQRGAVKGGDGAFTIDVLRSGMPSIEFLRDITVLGNPATRPLRAVVERPKVDAVLLETYTRHWFARGWVNRAPSSHNAKGGTARHGIRGPLTGKVAVVTGASSGIGAAVASALAREGAHVALAARRLDTLEALKRRIVVREGKIICVKTDVTKRADVENLIAQTEKDLGKVDILVSCAGVMYFTMMQNVHVEDWERTVDVNCKGLLNCLSSTVPGMLERGKGHIVAISSDAGRKCFPGLAVYSGSKAFVEFTLQGLRLETASSGLRVTTIQPGNTESELLGLSSDAEALKKYGEPTGAKVLDPEDVAGSIVYALKQPEHVSVNEVLIEPREEPI
ncbi:nonribosomal peptide synthetase 10 [Elsinoe ampelina]|uniref:Nonribosomal peptide synthetase 10 n=1 Tax=Elsinoe ampelina TaxID=302913 RepID=A0A6A6GGT5_9PEZI|nr:nonribosomal peptide synthetase 10 [Elsinoe ampelina]